MTERQLQDNAIQELIEWARSNTDEVPSKALTDALDPYMAATHCNAAVSDGDKLGRRMIAVQGLFVRALGALTTLEERYRISNNFHRLAALRPLPFSGLKVGRYGDGGRAICGKVNGVDQEPQPISQQEARDCSRASGASRQWALEAIAARHFDWKGELTARKEQASRQEIPERKGVRR